MGEVSHNDILRFAEDRVNMRRDDVTKYRQQVKYLREKLEEKIAKDKDYALMRMLMSGSLKKGTALRNLNDIDVAVYVKPEHVEDKSGILDWLAGILRDLYPNMESSQFTVQSSSVQISYRGSGLDVDVVPIIHSGKPKNPDSGNDAHWDGDLHSNENRWLMTNIPRHISFIRKRKEENPTHFRQIVRLLKYWNQQRKKENENFKCKSFMIELMGSHLADRGKINLGDYVEGLADFFNFVVRGGLDNPIVFKDYSLASGRDDSYRAPKRDDSYLAPRRDDNYCVPEMGGRYAFIRIFDPVNPDNNVASAYTQGDKNLLVGECGKSADMIDAAMYAPTKGKAQEYWRKIFGPAF